jgi:hypothetical protein
VRWRVPGEGLPDLLDNTLETSMSQIRAFEYCELRVE